MMEVGGEIVVAIILFFKNPPTLVDNYLFLTGRFNINLLKKTINFGGINRQMLLVCGSNN